MTTNHNPYEKVSMWDRSFWDLWMQKILRNFASVKYQFMVAFFTVVIYGMFGADTADGTALLSMKDGLLFLGGGFITLMTGRIAMRSSLIAPSTDGMDTDK